MKSSSPVLLNRHRALTFSTRWATQDSQTGLLEWSSRAARWTGNTLCVTEMSDKLTEAPKLARKGE